MRIRTLKQYFKSFLNINKHLKVNRLFLELAEFACNLNVRLLLTKTITDKEGAIELGLME